MVVFISTKLRHELPVILMNLNVRFMNVGLFALRAKGIRCASKAFSEGCCQVRIIRVSAAFRDGLNGRFGIQQE